MSLHSFSQNTESKLDNPIDDSLIYTENNGRNDWLKYNLSWKLCIFAIIVILNTKNIYIYFNIHYVYQKYGQHKILDYAKLICTRRKYWKIQFFHNYLSNLWIALWWVFFVRTSIWIFCLSLWYHLHQGQIWSTSGTVSAVGRWQDPWTPLSRTEEYWGGSGEVSISICSRKEIDLTRILLQGRNALLLWLLQQERGLGQYVPLRFMHNGAFENVCCGHAVVWVRATALLQQ